MDAWIAGDLHGNRIDELPLLNPLSSRCEAA